MFGFDDITATPAPDPGFMAPESPWALLLLFPLLAGVLVLAGIVIAVLAARKSRQIRAEAAERVEVSPPSPRGSEPR